MCGADMPMWIFKRVRDWEEAEDTKSIRQFGEEVVTDLCRRLLELGAPGIHFYTLNRAQASLKLCSNLGLGEGNENSGKTVAA
jgi:methylenetetrahydrofolate reductase (NADPH)